MPELLDFDKKPFRWLGREEAGTIEDKT